jgi:hypothetical protein
VKQKFVKSEVKHGLDLVSTQETAKDIASKWSMLLSVLVIFMVLVLLATATKNVFQTVYC